MDRAELLEFVLGKQTDVTIERWDLSTTPPSGVREVVPFSAACRIPRSSEEVFFVPANGQTLTVMSDSDDRTVTLPPSFVIETSQGRMMSGWRMQGPVSRAEYGILLGYLDPTSPPRTTETFRLPDTISTKHGVPFTCCVTEASRRIYALSTVFGLNPPEQTAQPIDRTWLAEPGPFEAGDLRAALHWMARRKEAVPKTVRILMERADLSVRSLMLKLIRLAGMNEREAIWCAEAAACNPYREWRYGAREELARQLVVSRTASGARSITEEITRIRGDKTDKRRPFEIRAKMATRAMEDFEANTTILRATDRTRWAIDKRTGIAMELIGGSDPIKHYINDRYGINPVDLDHKHLLEDMMRVASRRPNTSQATSISYYERSAERMLISFGGREIAILTKDGMEFGENGESGVIFRPVPGADATSTKLLPVEAALDGPVGAWWDRVLPPSQLENLTRGKPEEISALLHVWTLFFLFRNLAASRPILALLGNAGSGKTTFSKKIHLLLYGQGVKLFQVKDRDSWTTTVSNYPLALFDNVDTPTPWWLPPALALSITPTDATKRTLYSNNTPYVQRMDAMVGVSSHDAAFLKDDVIDRMILVQLQRIAAEDRLEETPMLDAVSLHREELLAGMMADVVRVLRTPRPISTRGSSIRIVDFAAIGGWIAQAIGKSDEFAGAIGTLSIHQKAKVLEEDIGLVMALEDAQRLSPLATGWATHTQLWQELMTLADDGGEALKSQYKNAQVFGRKLVAISTQLHDAIGLDMQDDPHRGWHTFKLNQSKPQRGAGK